MGKCVHYYSENLIRVQEIWETISMLRMNDLNVMNYCECGWCAYSHYQYDFIQIVFLVIMWRGQNSNAYRETLKYL